MSNLDRNHTTQRLPEGADKNQGFLECIKNHPDATVLLGIVGVGAALYAAGHYTHPTFEPAPGSIVESVDPLRSGDPDVVALKHFADMQPSQDAVAAKGTDTGGFNFITACRYEGSPDNPGATFDEIISSGLHDHNTGTVHPAVAAVILEAVEQKESTPPEQISCFTKQTGYDFSRLFGF